jgi:hypothetical protein
MGMYFIQGKHVLLPYCASAPIVEPGIDSCHQVLLYKKILLQYYRIKEYQK